MYYNKGEYNVLQSTNREDISAYIQSFMHEKKHLVEDSLDYSSIRSTIDDPETVPMHSVDLFVAPHMQQGRIVNEYMLDELIVRSTTLRTKSLRKNRSTLTVETHAFGRPSTTPLTNQRSLRFRST